METRYRVTNLSGTRRDPKRIRRTSASNKQVAVAGRVIPAGKFMYVTAEQYVLYKDQLDFYLKHRMIEVSAPTKEDLVLLNDAVDKALEEKELQAKEEPREEPKPVAAEPVVAPEPVEVIELEPVVIEVPEPEPSPEAPKPVKKKRKGRKKKNTEEAI